MYARESMKWMNALQPQCSGGRLPLQYQGPPGFNAFSLSADDIQGSWTRKHQAALVMAMDNWYDEVGQNSTKRHSTDDEDSVYHLPLATDTLDPFMKRLLDKVGRRELFVRSRVTER